MQVAMTQEYSRATMLLCYMGTHWGFLKMQHLIIILTFNHLMKAAYWFSFNQQVVKHNTSTLLLFNISTTINISTTLVLTVDCYYPAIRLIIFTAQTIKLTYLYCTDSTSANGYLHLQGGVVHWPSRHHPLKNALLFSFNGLIIIRVTFHCHGRQKKAQCNND